MLITLSASWLGGTCKLQEASILTGVLGHTFAQLHPAGFVGLSLLASSIRSEVMASRQVGGVNLGWNESRWGMNEAPEKEMT